MTTVDEVSPAFPGGIALASYGYDALSRRTQVTYVNGTNATYSYDQPNGQTVVLVLSTDPPRPL